MNLEQITNLISPPYLVGVRHRLAGHTATLSSLGHGGDAVGRQRFLLAVSSMLWLHHGGSIVLLLLLLLLTARSCSEIGATTGRLDGGGAGGGQRKRAFVFMYLLGGQKYTVCDERVKIKGREELTDELMYCFVSRTK